jgi:hypothetical protein
VDYKEFSTLKNTTFEIKNIKDKNIFSNVTEKIKSLRRVPFHSVYLVFMPNYYDEIYSLLELADIKIIGFIQNKDQSISMKVS